MQKSHEEAVEDSRDALLGAIGEPEDLTFIRLYGNKGDELIYAGTRQLLAHERFYKEVSVRNLGGVSGHTALVAGGGCWCGPYHDVVEHLPLIENKFKRVIIMPSSFDVSVPSVRATLALTKALVFARERTSFNGICRLLQCEALPTIAAFFFDYRPYLRHGEGWLGGLPGSTRNRLAA